MITCHLRYIIDPFKLKEFEHYGKVWIPLVEKFGGKHHGYFLPSEGANNVALAMFSWTQSVTAARWAAVRPLVRLRRAKRAAILQPSQYPARAAMAVTSHGLTSTRIIQSFST